MKRVLLLIAGSCFLLSGAACAAEPTPEPMRAPRPIRTRPVVPTSSEIITSPTPSPRPPTAVPTLVPTATRTLIPPTTTRTRIPATALPTFVPTLNPPPRPLVWDPRLNELKIEYVPANVQPGERYWRLTHAEFWAEQENQGKNHIFVNVLDENGARLIGETITIEWLDGSHVITTEDKPAPEYSANFPMDINHYPPWHSLGAYRARVNGLPSDIVQGMGRPPPKSRPVVYLLTFQRTVR